MFHTDRSEHALFDVRQVAFDAADTDSASAAAPEPRAPADAPASSESA
jgi:hypothetical protein